MKKTIVLVACATVLLGACGERVNTNSPQAYQRSITKMMEKMSDEEKARFTDAMTAIAFETADVGENSSANLFGRDPTNAMYFGGASEKVKGKTAVQIVRLGYEVRIRKLNEDIAAGMKVVQAARAEREKHRSTFEAIRIENPRFYVNRQFIVEPIIDFRITNGTPAAIRRGFFHGTLTTEGRSIPWVSEDFNTEFSGGLEPGESRHLRLSPNMFGEWGQGDHINRNDLKLTVTLVNVEDANGQALLTGQPDDPEALQQELAVKQQEKTQLEKDLAAL